MELITAVEKGHVNEQAHTFAFDILFSQLKEKLSRVPHLKVGGSLIDLEWAKLVQTTFPSCSGVGDRSDKSYRESMCTH